MSTNKPARANKPTNGTAAPAAEKKPRKARVGGGGDFNAELRALADKHRKRTSKLRSTVEKLESKLVTARRQLDAADEPLRRVERVLADNPELPGFASQSAQVPDEAAPSASSTLPDYNGAAPVEVSP